MPLGLSRKALSLRGERRTAKALGGRLQPASGATPFAKGDVRSRTILAECKDTTHDSFVLRKADFLKLMEQANQADHTGVFVIGFPALRVAVIPWDLFTDLIAEE